MPTVQVPLTNYAEFKDLKKASMKRKLQKRVELYEQHKKVAAELDELNYELFFDLHAILPADVKSVEYDGYQISQIERSASSRLNMPKLLNQVWPCPHCDTDIVLPARVVEDSKELGNVPKPTISVRKIGEDGE